MSPSPAITFLRPGLHASMPYCRLIRPGYISAHNLKHPLPPGKIQQCTEQAIPVGEPVSRQRRRIGRRDTAYRKIDHERTSNDILPRHKSPVATVPAIVAVIAQHEVAIRRNHQITVLRIVTELQPPACIDTRIGVLAGWELVTEAVRIAAAVDGIGFSLGLAVDINGSVDEPDVVPWNPDYPFNKVFAWLRGKWKTITSPRRTSR